MVFVTLVSNQAAAAPLTLLGNWHKVAPYARAVDSTHQYVQFLADPLQAKRLQTVDEVGRTGGHYAYVAQAEITHAGEFVIDFKNTSVIGQFKHSIFNAQNQLVASVNGGIENSTPNPFFLRHGREFNLQQGLYTIVTEVISPNFLAIPEPYLNDREDYQQSIKMGNAINLLGLGVFFGLGFYYAALAAARNRWVEAMYTSFILGNFLFNGAALLMLSDVFAIRSMYLVSMPILFSNIAYVIFVMQLLKINASTNKRLYWAGVAIIGVMSLFVPIAMTHPNWALELCRYGVGMFLSYGLITAISESRKNNPTAQRYLFAIAMFFVLGVVSISLTKIDSQFTFYIEHMGLMSAAIEVILLALVLSYQFSQLHNEKEKALEELEVSVKTAHSDSLTGLPNRHALVKEVVHLPERGSITFIDLDGLKFYNDTYGHDRGDALLCAFSAYYQQMLGAEIKLYRLGGDEFAALSHQGALPLVESAMAGTIQLMKTAGFEFAGASAGSVYRYEADSISSLMRIADARMYDNKRLRKLEREGLQEQLKFT